MTSALRWAAMRAMLMFHNCEGQSHKTLSTNHNFWRERRTEADSNRGPSAYQPNALPLGKTGLPRSNILLVTKHQRSPCYSAPTFSLLQRTNVLLVTAHQRSPCYSAPTFSLLQRTNVLLVTAHQRSPCYSAPTFSLLQRTNVLLVTAHQRSIGYGVPTFYWLWRTNVLLVTLHERSIGYGASTFFSYYGSPTFTWLRRTSSVLVSYGEPVNVSLNSEWQTRLANQDAQTRRTILLTAISVPPTFQSHFLSVKSRSPGSPVWSYLSQRDENRSDKSF